MASSMYNALQSQMNSSTALPVPKTGAGGTPGGPGYMSTPFIPTKVSNSNAPGSLASSTLPWLNQNNSSTSSSPISTSSNYIPPTGGPTLNSNPMGNPNSGIIGKLNSTTGLTPTSSVPNMSVAPAVIPGLASTAPNFNASNGYGTINPAAKTGTGTSTGTSISTVPAGDNVQNGIDLTKYNASMAAQGLGSNGLPITPAPNPNVTTTTSNGTPVVGTPTQNAQTVLNESNLNNNPTYNALGQQANELITAQSEGNQQATGGANNQSIGQAFGNLHLPQTTANQAGELNNFNGMTGAELQGNAAQQAQILAGGQLGTQGAETVLNSSLPTQVSPGNTLVNPITSTPTYGLGTGTGGNGADAYQNFSNLVFNTSQGQALAKQANDLSTAASQTTQNFNTLSNAMTAAGLNQSNYPTVNAFDQAVASQLGGAGGTSALSEAYNALQTSMSSIINSGNSGLTPTQITNLTNNQNISTLSPSQLLTLYNTVQQTMNTKIQTTQNEALSYEHGGTGSVNVSTSGSSDNSSLYSF